MTNIQRITFKNQVKDTAEFEMIEIQQFFSTRPTKHLQRVCRLDFWLLIYITEGKGYHCVDFERYEVKAGDMILMQKHQVHCFEVNKSLKGYILIFNEPFFYSGHGISSKVFLEFFSRPFKSPILSVDNHKDTTNRRLIEMIYTEYLRTDEIENEDFLRALFQSFIMSIRSLQTDLDNKISASDFRCYNRFRALIEENYKELKTVEEYANIMNVSKKTINKSTRSVVGLSAKAFIIERIILEIKRYLSQGELLNFEIADSLGFGEPSNMTKFFKRYVGVSPSEFKENIRN